jgi:hypothetical protein
LSEAAAQQTFMDIADNPNDDAIVQQLLDRTGNLPLAAVSSPMSLPMKVAILLCLVGRLRAPGYSQTDTTINKNGVTSTGM